MRQTLWMLAWALLVVGCRAPAPAAVVEVSPLVRIEVLTGTGDARPLVVAIHGLGGDAKGLEGLFTPYPKPARFIIAQAPTEYYEGWSWFPTRVREGEVEIVAKEVADAADEVAVLLREVMAAHPNSGKPVVTGFSQGGMLSFALATRHPQLVSMAIPLAGWLPAPLLPGKAPPNAPPIRPLHGDRDTVLPLGPTAEGVAALKANGWDVEMVVYPGVDHRITPPMRNELFRLIALADRPEAR